MPSKPSGALFEARVAETYSLICAAAAAGETCPTDQYLADHFKITTISQASLYVNTLAKRGQIVINRGNRCRVVSIMETGQTTAVPPRTQRSSSPRAAANFILNSPEMRAHRSALREGEAARLAALVTVDRTPCGVCGVRGDIGCKHNRGNA